MNRLFSLPNQRQHVDDEQEPLIEITEVEDELCQRFKWDKSKIEEIIQNLKSTDAFSEADVRLFPRNAFNCNSFFNTFCYYSPEWG